MEDQINALKCRRRHTVKNLLKIKGNLMCQTDELINLLKERQHELCFNIDELCHKDIWLHDDMLYKCWLSSPDFKDDLKFLKDTLTKEIGSLSSDMLRYDEKFEQLNLAITSFGRILRNYVVEENVAHEDPKFDHGKSRNKQIFNSSNECTSASNSSTRSKTLSDDSFEVMETTELCEEGIIEHKKHENLSMERPYIPDGMKCSSKVSDWLQKNDGIDKECMIVTSSSDVEEHANTMSNNSSHVPDCMKSSLKMSDWLHKNDSIDEEYMIESDNEETKIVAPLQMNEEYETLLFDECFAKLCTLNSLCRREPKSVPCIQSINTATFPTTKNDSSESSAIKDDMEMWLNEDSKSRGDKSVSIQPLNVSKGQSNTVQPYTMRSDLKTWVNNIDSTESGKSDGAVLLNYSSPAKIVEKSFSSYFVKDNHKEWLCSAKCV